MKLLKTDFISVTQEGEAPVVSCWQGWVGKAGEEQVRKGKKGRGFPRKAREGMGVEGRGRAGSVENYVSLPCRGLL